MYTYMYIYIYKQRPHLHVKQCGFVCTCAHMQHTTTKPYCGVHVWVCFRDTEWNSERGMSIYRGGEDVYNVLSCTFFCSKRATDHQWRKQLLRIFGLELIRINELMKTARSAVLKNRASAVYSERKFIIRWSTIFVKLALGVVFHVQIQTAWISIRYDFTEFSLGSACSLSEEVLVRITSIRTGDCLVCFFAASAAKFWKPLEARRTEHFPFSLVIFLVAQIPTKRGVLVHKNSLASYQWCRHSIEPCALTCPFRQSNLSDWSCSNL